MEISVHNKPLNISVNTVILTHNRTNPTNIYLFRCYNCGTGITQIQGDIRAILPGYIESDDVPTITKCHVCHTNYTFQTKPSSKSLTRVILDCEKYVKTFHCVICRTQLAQYNFQGIIALPGFTKLNVPSNLECFMPNCSMNYLIADLVEKAEEQQGD